MELPPRARGGHLSATVSRTVDDCPRQCEPIGRRRLNLPIHQSCNLPMHGPPRLPMRFRLRRASRRSRLVPAGPAVLIARHTRAKCAWNCHGVAVPAEGICGRRVADGRRLCAPVRNLIVGRRLNLPIHQSRNLPMHQIGTPAPRVASLPLVPARTRVRRPDHSPHALSAHGTA